MTLVRPTKVPLVSWMMAMTSVREPGGKSLDGWVTRPQGDASGQTPVSIAPVTAPVRLNRRIIDVTCRSAPDGQTSSLRNSSFPVDLSPALGPAICYRRKRTQISNSSGNLDTAT